MRKVAIIGVGMTPIAAGSDNSLRELFVEAATEAIEDAGVDKLDSMYVGNIMPGYLQRQEHLGAWMATRSEDRVFLPTRSRAPVRLEALPQTPVSKQYSLVSKLQCWLVPWRRCLDTPRPK